MDKAILIIKGPDQKGILAEFFRFLSRTGFGPNPEIFELKKWIVHKLI